MARLLVIAATLAALLVIAATLAAFAPSGGPSTASAAPEHRAACHRAHTCPSDHATYRWKGWLCVAPYSDKRNASFRKRIVYKGRAYWCKR